MEQFSPKREVEIINERYFSIVDVKKEREKKLGSLELSSISFNIVRALSDLSSLRNP
jgi:hypothetical protein